jgi:hypothetical protein
MAPEAIISLVIGTATIALTIIGASWAISSQLSKLTTSNQQQSAQISDIKQDISKLNDLVALVAVQKSEIASLREIQTLNTKRTDETFARIMSRMDKIESSRNWHDPITPPRSTREG